MVDGAWTGGTCESKFLYPTKISHTKPFIDVSWGTENRETPVRLTGPPGSHRFELRSVDGTASPYLVLAGVVAAGLEGLKNKRQLEIGDSAVAPANLTAEDRAKLGIPDQRLPSTIEEARNHLKNNVVLKQYLGADFITKYLAVNEVHTGFTVYANPD